MQDDWLHGFAALTGGSDVTNVPAPKRKRTGAPARDGTRKDDCVGGVGSGGAGMSTTTLTNNGFKATQMWADRNVPTCEVSHTRHW